jgi:hypothetical protein
MTRSQFANAARKAATKARLCDFRIIATEAEEGVVGTLRGARVRFVVDVVDAYASMSLRRQQLLEQIRSGSGTPLRR